jgi:hypothetical protein
MMSRCFTTLCAATLIVALPIASPAQQRGGGHPSAPEMRSAPAPAARPAAAPASRPAPAGGFNFSHDVAPPVPQQRTFTPPRMTAPSQPGASSRAVGPSRTITAPDRNEPARTGQPSQTEGRGHAPPTTGTGGPFRGHFNGPVIRNGRAPRGDWGWNRGEPWNPAPIYWGGGFWGPWAVAALGGAILFGSIADAQDEIIYPSYQVEADSPGAQLLQDYGLQQTPCGPPDLVAIWGPDNSVICAYPNDTVAPGNYQVDPATFTLVSSSS